MTITVAMKPLDISGALWHSRWGCFRWEETYRCDAFPASLHHQRSAGWRRSLMAFLRSPAGWVRGNVAIMVCLLVAGLLPIVAFRRG